MENDKIWPTNLVGGFWWQNQLIVGWFASLESLDKNFDNFSEFGHKRNTHGDGDVKNGA